MTKSSANLVSGKGAKRPVPGSEETRDRSYLERIGWGESSDKFLMDTNKLSWHADRLRQWVGPTGKLDGLIAPLHIDMGITTGCNLACHYCYGVIQARDGYLGNGKKAIPIFSNGEEMGFLGRDKLVQMPLETITSVFRDSKDIGIRSIALIGEGENTLNKALYPAIEFAREINFDVSLATHGANIRQEHVESLMTSLQWVRINISAATPESYERVHQRPWLGRVVDTTRLLVAGRDKHAYRNWRGKPTTIGFQMVLTKRNLDQVVPLAKLGAELGVDYTVIKACSDTPDGELDAPDQEYLELVDVFKEAEALSREDYSVIVRWNKLGNLGNKEYGKCHGTKFIIAMSGDGTVFPCGHWFARERERFAMGNVNNSSLRDILSSERYWSVQRDIHNIDLRMCETNCRQHACNQTLSQIEDSGDPRHAVDQMKNSSEQPLHVNFV
jgi:radical SAM protein with 4Fe4S-binding SPASM domain